MHYFESWFFRETSYKGKDISSNSNKDNDNDIDLLIEIYVHTGANRIDEN